MSIRSRVLMTMAVSSVLFLGAACTGDEAEPIATGISSATATSTATLTATGAATGTAPAGTVEVVPDGVAEVSVVLREWAVEPAESSVAGGEVYFLAMNEGPSDPHELVIVRTDLPADGLPTDERGFVPEDQVEVIGEIEPFAPGTSASGTFTLEPGRYVLICNIVELEDGEWESHYLEGMRTVFTVE